MQGTKVKGFAVSWEPIPDYLPNVTVILPVADRTTPISNPALDKLYEDTSRIHNLTVGCGSYREYYDQLKAALTRLGYEAYLKPLNITIDDVFPPIARELIDVAPGRQKPALPQTGPRPLGAEFLESSLEPHFTLLENSICEVTPRLIQPRDAWLNLSSDTYQTPVVDFAVGDALRSVEAAHSDHAVVWFVSLSYQAVASALGLQLEIKLFPDAPKRRQNVVNTEVVEDGFSKYITLRPSITRRLDGSEEIVTEATTENKANPLKTVADEMTTATSLLPLGTPPAAPSTVGMVGDISDVVDLITGIGSDNTTSESPDLAGLLDGIVNGTGLANTGANSNDSVTSDTLSTTNPALLAHPPTYAFMLFQLDPNGIQVTTEISLSAIEITSQIMAVASFFSLIFISLFTEQLSQRKMWLAPGELRPKLAAAGAVIVAVAASLRARCSTCFQPSSSRITNQVPLGSQLQVIAPSTGAAVP